MKNKITKWYQALTPKQKLGINFLWQWIFWIFAPMLLDQLWVDEEKKSLKHYFVKGTIMAILMTYFSNRSETNAIFKKKRI